jgi:hypothetical protein
MATQAAAAWAKPALLDLPACRNFKQAGPIAFCELKQGSGDSPLPGDLIVVDYTARAVANDNEVYDGSRNFKFTVGNGEVSREPLNKPICHIHQQRHWQHARMLSNFALLGQSDLP